jgi:hypothetical protein
MEKETQKKRDTLQETLIKYPDIQVGKIMGNRYRVMGTNEMINLIIRLGFRTKNETEDPLILIPREGRSNDFSIIEFLNEGIVYNGIEEKDIEPTLEITKGALEIILGYNKFIEFGNRKLTSEEKKQLTNLDSYKRLDEPTMTSAQTMLNMINEELNNEQEY